MRIGTWIVLGFPDRAAMVPKPRAVKFMVIEGTSQKDGMAIALERIAEEADRRTGRLDLRSLGLESLPEELFALTHLRELDLGCDFFMESDIARNLIDAQRSRFVTF